MVVVELDRGRFRRQRDLNIDGLSIDPDAMGSRRTVVEPDHDRDRHTEPTRYVLLLDATVEDEWVGRIDQPRDFQVGSVGRDIHTVDPLVKEPAHRFTQCFCHGHLEGGGRRCPRQMVAEEFPHQTSKGLVVASVKVDEHHSEHVQNEGALLVYEESVVDRRLAGSQAISDRERT